ncbi:MAG: NAD-glutamate dehydrogenase, partial [Candidatus Latescibacteria bacterium]|nr:NAD-glutamate dehydrogenase [Candidatus Latescibacterota bacterium]
MKTLKDISKNSFLNEIQLKEIENIIVKHDNYNDQAIRGAIDWFCTGLGMPEYYFKTTPIDTIASHIEAIKAAEIIAATQKEGVVEIDMRTELESEAIYLIDDRHFRAYEIERLIEGKYPGSRLKSYRAIGKGPGVENLRMYLVEMPQFPQEDVGPEDTDLQKIASTSLLNSATKRIFRRYQKLIDKTRGWESPLIEVSHKKESGELRVFVIANSDSSSRCFSSISDVLNSHGLVSNRKYVEPFANGKTVYAVYLDDITDDKLLHDLIEDISLVYVIPESPISPLFREGKLSAQETVFGVAACTFAHQFLTEYDEEYLELVGALKDAPEMIGLLRTFRRRLAKGSYDEGSVWDALVNNYDYLKKSFQCFDKKFNPYRDDHDINTSIAEFHKNIGINITVEIDKNVFESILLFIEVIQKTNFYRKEKTSLSFMLNPEFLNKVDYPEVPFGVFLVIGSEFRGFHIRFRDIARGGIRMVRSHNIQSFLKNSDSIFDENYSLALTQQQKNKDIPEGGSKGTILLEWTSQDKAEAAFKKYIDGLLDLILPDSDVVDHSGDEVILFLGPDEGTAELMEWTSLRARARGYPYWKAFATGKPLSMGGIPHDLYGMTTNSVHEYVM